MRALPWRGSLADALALERALAAGVAPRLVAALDSARRDPATGVPDFVLQEQAACLGVELAFGAVAAPEESPPEPALARGYRGVVVGARGPEGGALVGRVLDEALAAEARAAGVRLATLAFDGPAFARRVDLMAGETHGSGAEWRLDVGLRGC